MTQKQWHQPTYEELLKFVMSIARLKKDGDIINGEEYEADGNDDEVDALYSLISSARDMMGTDGSDLVLLDPARKETLS